MLEYLIGLDQFLMEFINIGMANPFFDSLMVFITHLGSPYLWAAVGAVFLFRKKVSGIALGLGLGISSGIVLFLKSFIMRARPQDIVEGVRILVTELDASFPSGHTSTAFVSVVVLSNYYPKGKPVFYSLAGLIALSRIYVGVHFPVDVVIGGALGYIVAKSVLKLPVTKYSKCLGFNRKL